jgi:predicted transcriptional regulator
MDMMKSSAAFRLVGGPRLPHEVALLLPREREIATIVYRLGASTAAQVEGELSAALSNSAVRSMLNRLVAKGILKRVLAYRTFVYLPALTPRDSGCLALKQFAADYFDGSVERAATVMSQLLDTRA